jgi:Fe-S-cluster containining protein
MTSREFLQGFTRVEADARGGFPCVFMTMRDDERHSCPMVRDSGCSVYADRPAACRAYPTGRGVGVEEGGLISEQFVLVREEHCRGFEAGPSWSIEKWLRDQGVDEYLPYIDSYSRLTARWSEDGRSLRKEQFALVFLALYRLDEFPRFIEHHGILDGLKLSVARKSSILEDEAERLSFAIRWIESLGDMCD